MIFLPLRGPKLNTLVTQELVEAIEAVGFEIEGINWDKTKVKQLSSRSFVAGKIFCIAIGRFGLILKK